MLPTVLRPLLNSELPAFDIGSFPVNHYSASSMIKFSTNQILFKILYMNRDKFETTRGISGIIGTAFHKAMEVYMGGVDEMKPSSEEEAIQFGMNVGMNLLENYPDGFINYSKTITNKQKAFDLFSFAFTSYVTEMPYRPETVIGTEEEIEEAIDVDWRGDRLQLPVPLKGYIDRIEREDGKLKIRDYKTCMSFSDGDKIDGAKILQAVVYYLLVYAKYGEEPYSVIFDETKMTKNKDGGKQVRQYEMVFADNQLYFDFFFRFYQDMTRALNGEMVFVPNVQNMFDNEVSIIAYIHRLDEVEEKVELMRKHKVSTLTDLLLKEMQSAGNMRKLLKTVEEHFIEGKNMNYEDMSTAEKIRNKLMEHGVMLKFNSEVEGSTVDLFRYEPSMSLKMSKIKAFASDVEQVLGVSGVRILAPIPNSTLVGFEVPRTERTFPNVPGGEGFDVAIGQTIMGEPRRFDIRSAPHMLVAGASGSGKSVFLNALIEQLFRIPNADLYLYDPKMVELAKYEGRAKEYSHSPEGIMTGLLALEEEMDNRYQYMKEKGVRNISETDMRYKFVVIDEFGDFIMSARDAQKGHAAAKYTSRSRPWLIQEVSRRTDGRMIIAVEQDGNKYTMATITKGMTKDEIAEILERNDELNPLLGVNVENILIRLAQKARACGIHFIIATQRPSVDVISGNIKNNFPTKVVFRTAKEIDSRIVIDDAGAEKLAGKGDMLFVGDNGVERLQGYNS